MFKIWTEYQSSELIFCWFFASQNWFVETKTKSTTFIFWPPQDYQSFKIKTAMNASSFVILDCRKSNNSCWLSRLLIGFRTWSKWKSCWSHFIFCKSNLKWKISTKNQNLWLIFWFSLFRFYLFFHSWSKTYIKWRLLLFLYKLKFNIVEVVYGQLIQIAWFLRDDCDSKVSGVLSFSVFQYILHDI